MRLPLSWIRDFTDCSLPVEEIAHCLTMSGIEVEAIDRIGVFSHEVVVAEVVDARDHPEGRDLRVVEIALGGERRVVALTGAPNLPAGSKGLKVAAALPDALLVDPKADEFELFSVEEREILGVTSSAVLCSAKELGLADDHSGVLILEPDATPGKRLHEQVKLPPNAEADGSLQADIVLEIAVLPNYGRCLSMIGVARELAALARCSFQLELPAEYISVDPDSFPVKIADPELCSRYSACVLAGIAVKRSPPWMERRLVLAGLKPINNLVDVTNYVMLEIGQPMHAFDLEKLPARDICVRRARRSEELYTLDQKPEPGEDDRPRPLDESVLLITSGDTPVAVAGVIGGRETQIEATTRSILLESANFDFISIRKAMAALKLTTDAAIRFSRQVDPALTVLGIQRAARLLKEVADAEPEGAIADCFPRPPRRLEISVTAKEIRRTLGMDLGREEIAGALERLGFTTELEEGESEKIKVDVPGFRPDVTIPHDIAEEVIRVVGLERLEPQRLAEPLPRQRRNLPWELRERLRDALVGCNLQDIITYSLTTPESEARLQAGAQEAGDAPPYVRILNPSSQERAAMRRTLLGGLLETVARNHRHRQRIAVFEIGLVFHPESGDGILPREPMHLAMALSGPISEPSWMDSEPREYGFYDIKGIVRNLLDHFHLTDHAFVPAAEAPFHPGIATELRVAGQRTGVLGQLHPAVRDAYDLGKRTVVAGEFELERWLETTSFQYAFRPFSRFPPVHQDLALEVDDDIPAERVLEAIREAAGTLLADIRLFDVYRGKQLGEGKKSLAFQLTFCADDRSLSEDEVNALRDSMLRPLEKAVGARIR